MYYRECTHEALYRLLLKVLSYFHPVMMKTEQLQNIYRHTEPAEDFLY